MPKVKIVLFCIVLGFLTSLIRQGKTGKKDARLYLQMPLLPTLKNFKNLQRQKKKKKISKVAKYIIYKKAVVYLHSSSQQLANEVFKIIIYNSLRHLKYPGINLTKDA